MAAADDASNKPTTPGSTPGVARDHGRAGRNLPAAIAVGVGLFLLLVITLGWFNLGFVIIMAAALALGSIEVSQAMHKIGIRTAIIPIVIGTVAIIIGSYVAHVEERVNSNLWMLGILGMTVLISLVWRMPGGSEGYIRDASGSMLIIGWIPFLGAFASMMLAGDQGPVRVITFLVVIVLSDTGGYAVGVLFGKHPMAPRISPKKSWEGFAGSLFFGTAGAVFMMVIFFEEAWWTGLVLGVGLVLAGACGDLVESLVKRDIGIKDMSSFLPGHGGVMDRLDSLLLAAPVGWLVLLIFVPGG
ncbi:phosphatidate cytidylyltransferase [Naumannella halotolerans]|uniref:Phosphatidate cytidylyltransferase n=1 Tax=Naumannella halotolerans TaxID=993414 RepID=A0A4R7J8M8_9ACTN|nr:phosphatidate cytidylyltransferase [Naumannella halotolerans]TDT32897.1 phosphatidate cytidylyltransferase [Naumannella halotolerans]